MRKRFVTSASFLLLATQFCYARGYTLAVANFIIAILFLIVIVLIVLGCYSLHYNRIISRRNEQMQRILAALDDYRELVGNGVLAQDGQKEVLKKNVQETKKGPSGPEGREAELLCEDGCPYQ